jgi:hypothetical protein
MRAIAICLIIYIFMSIGNSRWLLPQNSFIMEPYEKTNKYFFLRNFKLLFQLQIQDGCYHKTVLHMIILEKYLKLLLS